MITDKYDFENREETKEAILREIKLLINSLVKDEFRTFKIRYAIELIPPREWYE